MVLKDNDGFLLVFYAGIQLQNVEIQNNKQINEVLNQRIKITFIINNNVQVVFREADYMHKPGLNRADQDCDGSK